MSWQPVAFEVRDLDRRGAAALAAAADYNAAVVPVRWLHRLFRDQLEANGEGGGSSWQHLVVMERHGAGWTPCLWSPGNGVQLPSAPHSGW